MEIPTIVAGSLRDIHSVGLRVLGYTLEDEFNFVHVGSMVDQEELIKAAIETKRQGDIGFLTLWPCRT